MITRRKLLLSVIAITALGVLSGYLLFSRGKQPPSEPKIYLNQDTCHRCRMLISDIRFAAAMLLSGENDFRKYDDIGCMLSEYVEERDKHEVLAVIVHDYLSGKPIKAENAWFVVADVEKLWTPMAYGVIALENYEEAVKQAEKYDGEMMNWEELVKKYHQYWKEVEGHEKHTY